MAKKCENCIIKEKYKYWNKFPPTKHRFFTTMPIEFKHKLKVPSKFAECFKEPLSSQCTLMGPSGDKWKVKFSDNKEGEDGVFFSEGWDSFVEDNGVGARDFMIFRYVGESCFEVVIFDGSGCEREGSHFATNGGSQRDCCPSAFLPHQGKHDNFETLDVSNDSSGDVARRMSEHNKKKRVGGAPSKEDRESLFEDYEDEEALEGSQKSNEEEAESFSIRPNKRRRKWGRPKSSSRAKSWQMCYVSNRRKLKDTEKIRGSLKADGHEPKGGVPMFSVVMRPTNVYSGFNTTIPKKWALKHMSRCPHQVVLRVPAVGKSWIVGCRWTTLNQCQLRANWPTFVLENTLEEHDVCVFELVKKATSGNKAMPAMFDVYIYRVVDKPVSLTVSRRLV